MYFFFRWEQYLSSVHLQAVSYTNVSQSHMLKHVHNCTRSLWLTWKSAQWKAALRWDLHCSGTLFTVDWWLVTDVSERSIGPNVKGQSVQIGLQIMLLNICDFGENHRSEGSTFLMAVSRITFTCIVRKCTASWYRLCALLYCCYMRLHKWGYTGVPFILSQSTGAVRGCPDGCRISLR